MSKQLNLETLKSVSVLTGRMAPEYIKRRTLNDDVYTTATLAAKIVAHFAPQFHPGDRLLEPCAGNFAFYDAFPDGYEKDWCEVKDGRDFLDYSKKVNWVISNFPWSGKALRPIVRHACEVSTNVVHLIRAHNILGTFARQRDFLGEGHRIKEIIATPWAGAFHNKMPEGFMLMVIHTQKNYGGDCRWNYDWME